MAHDFAVFISYSSKDRLWAERLFKDLKNRGVPDERIFFDRANLRAGQTWEPQLAASVPKAQHLVVLWTESGRGSDWVREETIRFKTVIDPNGTGPLDPDRQLFPIIMGTELSSTLTRYHAFTSVKDVNVEAGPDAMSPVESEAWTAIVRDIAETVNPPRPERPWPVAVLAATTDALARTPPVPFEGDFATFLPAVGIPSRAAFDNQYGANPRDWKPFGSIAPISQVLDELLEDVNARLHTIDNNAASLRWQYVDLITTPIGRVDDEVQKLSTGPCLLVIDSMSLLVQHVAQRYSHLLPCFENPHALIQWLTPFAPHEPVMTLRNLVKTAAQPFILGYYEPIPPKAPRGRCALNVADSNEMARLFLAAFADQSALTASGVVPSVLSVEKRP